MTNPESDQTSAPPPPSAPPPSPVDRAKRSLRTVLILSLAANLLLLGLLAGSFAGGHWRDRRDGPDVGFGPLTRALSPDDKRALFKGFMAKGSDFRGERAAVRADIEAFATALRADPFDRASADASLERLGQRGARRMEEGKSLLLDHIASMTAEERATFADRVIAGLKLRGDKDDEHD